MSDLIEALQILLKYGNPKYPTHCEHDELTINPEIYYGDVSPEDRERLEALGFFIGYLGGDESESVFRSSRFGSC
jgi:hypothetical protein